MLYGRRNSLGRLPSFGTAMTNAFALASASLAVLTLVLGTALWAGAHQVGTAISLVSLIFTLFEMFRVGQPQNASPVHSDGNDNFHFPMERGLWGGLFGGVVAAPIIGLAFLKDVDAWRPYAEQLGHIIPSNINIFIEILVASISIAVVLGLLSLGMALYFDHIRKRVSSLGLLINRLTGGILGGVLAGLITGPIGTLYFGLKPLPVLHPQTLLLGALPATGVIVFSILNYDRHKFGGRSLKKFMLALVATAIVSVLAVVALTALGPEILSYLQNYVVSGTRSKLLQGGLYYGAFTGALLGSIVGLTLLLSGKEPTSPAHVTGGRRP